MHARRLIGYFLILGATAALFGIAVLLYIQWSTGAYIFDDIGAVPVAEAALVPGASVIGTSTLSQVLKERVDTAIYLYRSGRVAKLLVTGDNSSLSHNEVDPMGRYMLAAGVPKEDIFLDHAGFDTYSSLYRAREVFGVSSLVVVSQPFHLPRAVFIGRSLGIETSGLGAHQGEWFVFNYLREIPATFKALLDLTFARIPKYLGPTISIEGNASSTWSY